MQKLQPYDPAELDNVAAIAHGSARAWTVRTGKGPELVWAISRAQAAAITSKKGATISGISPNYHAQNMTPRPADWSEFIAMGGEQ